MADLHVDPEALRSFGRQTEEHGMSVSAEGQKGEFDTAAMSAVFGLIGADFMAVAALVTNTHNHQLTETGGRYTKVGRAVENAAQNYTDTDAQNAKQFGGSGQGGQDSQGKSSNPAAAGLANGLDPTNPNLSKEQVAKIIIARGKKMGMSDDEIKSALATGLVESNLRNLNYGDRDSVGVFQQRNFAPWTVNGRNRMNVDDAATSYFEQVRGTSGSPGQRAQEVQKSAYPDRYNEHMGEADSLFNSLASTASEPAPAAPGAVPGAAM